jgi:hypothetical protein
MPTHDFGFVKKESLVVHASANTREDVRGEEEGIGLPNVY